MFGADFGIGHFNSKERVVLQKISEMKGRAILIMGMDRRKPKTRDWPVLGRKQSVIERFE